MRKGSAAGSVAGSVTVTIALEDVVEYRIRVSRLIAVDCDDSDWQNGRMAEWSHRQRRLLERGRGIVLDRTTRGTG